MDDAGFQDVLQPELGYGEDLGAIRTFGEEVVTKLCARLLEEGAPGLHFYTLNRAEPALAIWNNLELGNT